MWRCGLRKTKEEDECQLQPFLSKLLRVEKLRAEMTILWETTTMHARRFEATLIRLSHR
jgi:hypothetical protein